MVKKKIRCVHYAEGPSGTGEGYFRKRIAKKDIGFYKVRGYKIATKCINPRYKKRRKESFAAWYKRMGYAGGIKYD